MISVTKVAGCAVVLFAVVGGFSPAAANPSVTSINPKSLYACASPGSSPRGVTLYGHGLVANTTGYTFNSDVRILVRHNGGSFAPTGSTGWGPDNVGVELRCADFSQTVPGQLDFQIVLRGVPSNVVTIPLMAIPSRPPSISSVSPSQRDVGLTGASDYLLQVVGKDMPDDTSATIGGERAPIGRANFGEGVMSIWVPKDLQSRAGTYAVQLHNSRGDSNTVNLTIGHDIRGSLPGAIVLAPPPRTPPIARADVNATTPLDVQLTNVAGHVTLKGRANSIEAKAQLIAAIRAMPGVFDVTDLITVDPAPIGNPHPLPH